MRIHLFSFRLLWGGILSGLFYVLVALYRLFLAPEITTDTGTRMLIFTITMFLVGCTEEALFRGLIQNALHKVFGEESWQAVWAAVVQATVGLALVYLLPALIVLRPKKVRPLLGKVGI
jgi:membrane protease YdiL (CAAX protease family)